LSDHLSLYRQTIKAYQTLGHHILALKLDMEVYMKVLEPLVEVAMLELDVEYVHSFNIDFLIRSVWGWINGFMNLKARGWIFELGGGFYEPHGLGDNF